MQKYTRLSLFFLFNRKRGCGLICHVLLLPIYTKSLESPKKVILSTA